MAPAVSRVLAFKATGKLTGVVLDRLLRDGLAGSWYHFE